MRFWPIYETSTRPKLKYWADRFYNLQISQISREVTVGVSTALATAFITSCLLWIAGAFDKNIDDIHVQSIASQLIRKKEFTDHLLFLLDKDSSFIGKQGEQGPKGEQGIQGLKGPKGERGEIGPQGQQGPRGLQGLKGPKGDIGPAGPEGEKGENYTPLVEFFIKKGNSGKITCDLFCKGDSESWWAKESGTCVSAKHKNSEQYLSCGDISNDEIICVCSKIK